MSRRSLRPQLNQIRGWVRQGRTDAWIAHQLEVTVQQIQSFKRENELEADGDTAGEPIEEVDLRAEDDAAIAAELEAEAARRAEEEAKLAEEAAKRAADEDAEPDADDADAKPAPRKRARRSTRTRRREDATGIVRRDLRPRRGGLRAVARSRRRGQPDLRGALGGPPARRGHDRGGPDRHPPRQWRRQRLISRACAHTARRCSSAPPAGPSRSRTARPTSRPSIRPSGTSTCWSSTTRRGCPPRCCSRRPSGSRPPPACATARSRSTEAETRSWRASARRAGPRSGWS